MAQHFENGDSFAIVRGRLGQRIAELEQRVGRMKPKEICARMDSIRSMAVQHGLTALEGLAGFSAHHALLPGHRQATRTALEHMDVALDATSESDREKVLAAIAIRLH